KLGLAEFDPQLLNQLIKLMSQSEVDYTIFFRELSNIPDTVLALKKSFYVTTSTALDEKWQEWLTAWRKLVIQADNREEVSKKMKQVNPKFTWREWLIVPAYEKAQQGDYSLVKELQEVLDHPYEEQSQAIAEKYYRLKPKAFLNAGGISHYSCSS
ncbi:MAG: protein adenylyltransferase SelO family protein, partial [Candidatus Latescibacteria bacterium]|nr:protein adenylyltransferase SelO family protein [Candidatus Latescibacterota bacterium]